MPTDIAYGLGFRTKHYERIVGGEPTAADFYEIISENFMNAGGRPRRFLGQLKERYPVAAHGVGLSIAGPDALDAGYLKALRDLVRWLRPCFVSDHLCWTGRAHQNAHDLLPVPLTEAMLAHVAPRVRAVQDALDCRLYLENPSSYVQFAGDEMDEATFLAELTRRTGCGLLLDVNNLYVNTMNLGFEPLRYLATLPPDAVGYFHLAGHAVNPDVRIDTHDAPVCAEVWALYRVAARRFPLAPTLVEWDDKLPEFEGLEAELLTARRARDEALGADLGVLERAARALMPAPTAGGAAPAGGGPMHDTMLAMVVQAANVEPADPRLALFDAGRPVSAVRGINVYNDAYFFRLRDILAEDLPTLAALVERPALDRLLMGYLTACPPTSYDINDAGAGLPAFLRVRTDADSAVATAAALADVAALELARSAVFGSRDGEAAMALPALAGLTEDEWAEVTFRFRPCVRLVATDHDVGEAWDAVANDQAPPPPLPAPSAYLVYRRDEHVYHEALTPGAARLYAAVAAGTRLEEACQTHAGAGADGVDAEAVTATIAVLAHWTGLGLVAELRPALAVERAGATASPRP